MDNGFNNENMNQFQNNNFNNGYVNNQNNKNDSWKNVLIGVMSILIVGLAALTVYVVVDKKDNNVDDNKDNNIQENENKDNNVNNIPEKDYAKLQQKVLDEYYLTTTDIIDENILEYKYSAIANNEISYNDFRKNIIVKNIIASLEPIGKVGGNDGHVKDEYDKNGVKYPDYCGDYANSCVENIAKDFGLTVDEISKMDKSVWSTTGGQYHFIMYDAKEVKDKYLDIYNDIFNSSFSIYLSDQIYGVGYTYKYDKNLDKIITGGHGGTAGFYERVIIESKEENNLYKLKFVEGYFSPGGKWMSLDIDSNEDISDSNEASDVIKRNKDKLPNYEVTFEKTSNGYKFKEIKKVS